MFTSLREDLTTLPETLTLEDRRLAALNRYDVLDTPREEAFDRITRLIRNIFDVPIAIVSMIDGHRQWYKAVEGLSNSEVARGETFCQYTIQGVEPIVVLDARDDLRFAGNPSVTGHPHIRFYAGVPLRTPTGENIGSVCAIGFEPRAFTARETAILADLTKMAMRELELRELASTDDLTGVLSRGAFKTQAANAIALAIRHNHFLGGIVFDLDHFKNINDTYGHAAGDLVLQRVTEICREHLRSTDIFGRIGGEEFAVILPHTNRDSLVDVAEKLREVIASLRLDFVSGTARISASFGVAALATSTDLETLLSNADAALYRAKAAGRNRCEAWQEQSTAKQALRRRVLKAGRILFNNRNSTIDCTVKSLGADGAGLNVTSSIGVPEKFNLEIASDRLDTLCRIVSQSERHIEVAFI